MRGSGWWVHQDLLSPVFLRRGEIHARLGHREEALKYYGRFVTRWRNADPEYQPLVGDVEVRIARLSGSRGD